MSPESGRPFDAVFLDRDGVLNTKAPEGDYVTEPEGLELLPRASDAVRRLDRLGIPVFVVTNQRWVARTRDGARRLAAVHRKLNELLDAQGARLTGIFACTHEIGECGCRKPLPGLVEQALSTHADLRIDPGRCALIGDSESDIEVGTHFAMTTVLLAPPRTMTRASYLADSLDCATRILESAGRRSGTCGGRS